MVTLTNWENLYVCGTEGTLISSYFRIIFQYFTQSFRIANRVTAMTLTLGGFRVIREYCSVSYVEYKGIATSGKSPF